MKKSVKVLAIAGYLAGCYLIGQYNMHSRQNTENQPNTEVYETEYSSGRYEIQSTSNGTWELLAHMDYDGISLGGRESSGDYPYGYNVGKIHDEAVGDAVLLTPGTSVTVERYQVAGGESLSVTYGIHPWVAQKSDGAQLVIEVLKDTGEREEYVYAADGQFRTNELMLDSYRGECISISFQVRNENGKDEQCDWIILKDVFIHTQDKSAIGTFGKEGYVKSATYFSDEWAVNFWNSEMDGLTEELARIHSDGFDSIILVIPWREFQTATAPVTYNPYAFDKLHEVMAAAQNEDLDVYARIGYLWDYYEDDKENIVDRFCNLMGDESVQNAWFAYVGKMYQTLSGYGNFKGGFLTWEDFWNNLGVCDENEESVRRSKASFIGYTAWVRAHYSIEEYNEKFGTSYASYSQIPVPKRNEPAMEAMFEFYDYFLENLLEKSQDFFPNLSMEVRMDWDLIYKKDNTIDYYKHYATYDCGESDYTVTMYGIPMGFENKGETVSSYEAVQKTEYILQQFKQNNSDKAVYIDQFIFADNTPVFSQNARIIDSDLNNYLKEAASVLRTYSEGYGIWTYQNYCCNMLYNPQFALDEAGWNSKGTVEYEEYDGSKICRISDGSSISQTVGEIRNHFPNDEYIVRFEIKTLDKSGVLKLSVGEVSESVEISSPGEYQVKIKNPLRFDIKIESEGCECRIDNIRLYSQVQQGYLYDEYNQELQCISGIRELNEALSGGRE